MVAKVITNTEKVCTSKQMRLFMVSFLYESYLAAITKISNQKPYMLHCKH